MAANKFFEFIDKFRSLSTGSEDATALYCQPCAQDKKEVSAYGYCQNCAEHLCEECYKIHTRPAPSRGHVLMDKSKMPKSQAARHTCAIHDGEAIKYHCKDHNYFGCSQCEDIHRNCNIFNINKVTKGFQSSEEYKNILQRIQKLKSTCINVNKTVKENMEIIQQSRETIRKEVETCRKQINDRVDRWEKDLFDQNDRFHNIEYAKATSTLCDSRDILQQAEQLHENLKMQQAAGNNTRLYIQVKKDERILDDMELRNEYIKDAARSVHSYYFLECPNIFNTHCSGIGQILEFQ